MVSIKDVAGRAGVAISTVSKVLNHYPNVSSETRKKVEEAIRELNFVPNSVAAALSSKQAGRVALLLNLEEKTQITSEIGMQCFDGASWRANVARQRTLGDGTRESSSAANGDFNGTGNHVNLKFVSNR